jgi:hypothetical protein
VPARRPIFTSDFSTVDGTGYSGNGMSKFSRISASGTVREPHRKRDISNFTLPELIEREQNAINSLRGRLAVQPIGPTRDRMLSDLHLKTIFLERLEKDARRFAAEDDPTTNRGV